MMRRPAHLPLSVLDLAPVPSGSTAADALANTVHLARQTERLGYHRYWLAEHHLASGVASSAPAVLIALVAAATTRIRVGSGAVLLANTTPLQAAEQFGTIAHLHPGRIDLGLGRSGPSRLSSRTKQPADQQPPVTVPDEPEVVDGVVIPGPTRFVIDPTRLELQAALLRQDRDAGADYATEVAAIEAFLTGEYRAEDGELVQAAPAEGANVELWVLGSSAGASSRTAGGRGLPYAANYHVAPSSIRESVGSYREAFRPSTRLDRPYVMVSADVVVADDDATARRLASPYGAWVAAIRGGGGAIPFPSPEEAAALEWTDEQRALVADRVATQLVGSPEVVVERLRALARLTDADELLVTTITHDHSDRVRSYELLADAWADSMERGSIEHESAAAITGESIGTAVAGAD